MWSSFREIGVIKPDDDDDNDDDDDDDEDDDKTTWTEYGPRGAHWLKVMGSIGN